MLQALLVRIIIISPVSGSDFSEGDEISVWVNTSTGDISVLLNDSPYAGGAGSSIGALGSSGGLGFEGVEGTFQIISGVTSYQSGYAISGYSRCDEGDLIWYRMPIVLPSFPYMEQVTTVDSPVCGVGQACDIHFTGPLQLTHAKTLTSNDGQVVAVAFSSNADLLNPVKYGLTDFDYATEGQESGTITGLSPGNYTVYAKDKNGCTTQKDFTILYKPEHAEHYRFTWTPLDTGRNSVRQSRIRIYEREYIGSVVEKTFAGVVPFNLFKPKKGDLNDKFHPIHPTNATLTMMSTEDYEWLPLYTYDDKKFRVDYEVDTGGGFEVVWSGFHVPSVYVEPFVAAPYPVSLTFTDNLEILNAEPFTDEDGNQIDGEQKIIKVISFILKKTGLALPIRSGINIYETNHNTTASDDPLDQTYVDTACYRRDGEPFTCAEVLEALLRPFGARILQASGQWVIEEIDRATASYAYRVFDFNGDYSSNGTFDPIKDIKAAAENNRVALTEVDHSMEVIPAYGKVEITRKYNYVGSIISGGFEKSDLLSPESEKLNLASGVFSSEEGFRDWTLRLNGTTGVSFGRAEVEDNQKEEQDRRSVGVFYFSAGSWSGNLRDAYIESAAKAFQYGPGDSIRFRFDFANTSSKERYPFGVIRFSIKLGTDWLQEDLTWDSTEFIYRVYPEVRADFQTVDFEIPVPDVDEVTDSTIQVRIYFYAPEFFDYGLPSATNDPDDGTDGITDLKAISTADKVFDYRADVRYGHEITIVGISKYIWVRLFCQLVFGAPVEDVDLPLIIHGIIKPDDYDGTTNQKVWRVIQQMPDNARLYARSSRSGVLPRKFYIDNVTVDGLVNGQPPVLEETEELSISQYVDEVLEVELFHGDIPDITNAVNMYNNYFRLEDGTPTRTWARSGVSEALPLHKILLSVLGSNHAAPTFRLTGTFMYEFGVITPDNYIRLTKPGSNLSLSNTTFDSDLSGWTEEGTGESWVWDADFSGSAEVELSGAEDSTKLYQEVAHSGGYCAIHASIKIIPGEGNDREDALFALLYKDGAIIHTERLKTFAEIQTETVNIIDYKLHIPGFVDAVGFYIKNLTGTGTCVYQLTEFDVTGGDIQEVYQISDYMFDDFSHKYRFELMQLSKSYISLEGTDTGGDPQKGSTDPPAFDEDYQAILDYALSQSYSIPTLAQQVKQNQFVLDLKAAGIWTQLDLLYVFATDGDRDFAKINWIDPGSFTATEHNTPSFTVNEGFTGNGSNAYLNTGWDPDTNGVNFTLNECGFFAYVNNETNAAIILGVEDVGGSDVTGQIHFTAKNAIGNTGASLNGAPTQVANANSEIGFYHAKRTASNVTSIARNGVNVQAGVDESTSLTDQDLLLLAYNNAGTPTFFSTAQLSVFGIGASLTGKESALYEAWNDYFSNV